MTAQQTGTSSPPTASRGALPAPLTSLVGRTQEVTDVLQLIGDPSIRLVTLTGPGGVGKTRLALQAARILHETRAFADGVRFVQLAAVRNPDQVLPAIAQALDMSELGDRPVSVRLGQVLARRQLLVVLDNLEQVLTCAPQLTNLLAACPDLTILATSREVLHVQGEHELPVLPLGVPDLRHMPSLDALGTTESVALFVQRATAAMPSFRLTAENAPAIAQICVRLDGLPLAIELAAARIKVLPPHGLLARLDYRLALLTGGARDLPERQQTLRGTLIWSYDLLLPEEQRLLRRIAIFPGGCTLESAEAVTADGLEIDVLAGLGSLLDKSLLVRGEDPTGAARFTMLETVREFASEQLSASGEMASMRQRVITWVIGFMDSVMPDLGAFPTTPPHRTILARIEPELDNLRVAAQWGADLDSMRRLITGLGTLYFHCGYAGEGIETLERALTYREETPPAFRARVLFWLGWLLSTRRDFGRAEACAAEGLSIAQTLNDPEYLGEALHLTGQVAQSRGQFERAEQASLAAITQFRLCDNHVRASHALALLGFGTYRRGDPERATQLFESAIAESRQAGSAWCTAVAQMFYARVVRDRGEHAAAVHMWVESSRMLVEHGDRMMFGYSLRPLARLAAQYRQPELATRLLAVYSALDDTIGLPLGPYGQSAYDSLLGDLKSSLPSDVFEAAWTSGYSLSLGETIELAASICIPATLSSPQTSLIGSPYGLTARELDVLRLLVDGYSSQDIADKLAISSRTVTTHVANIFSKLDVNSRSAAVALALRERIISYEGTPRHVLRRAT